MFSQTCVAQGSRGSPFVGVACCVFPCRGTRKSAMVRVVPFSMLDQDAIVAAYRWGNPEVPRPQACTTLVGWVATLRKQIVQYCVFGYVGPVAPSPGFLLGALVLAPCGFMDGDCSLDDMFHHTIYTCIYYL